jgi:hypothetical protein
MVDAGVQTCDPDQGSQGNAALTEGLSTEVPGLAMSAWRDFFGWNPAVVGGINLAIRRQHKVIAMPRENDLEGVQDQGGKHGGQKGMPRPEPKPSHGHDQGIVRQRGEEQPRDKERAQHVSRQDRGGDPPGHKA